MRTIGKWEVFYDGRKFCINNHDSTGNVERISYMADYPDAEASAEYICKVVNNHEKMKDMIEEFISVCDFTEPYDIHSIIKTISDANLLLKEIE